MERLGRYQRFGRPGFNWVIPVIDRLYQVNVTEQMVDADPQGAVGLSLEGANRDGTGLLPCLEGRADLARAVLATKLPELYILPLGRTSPDDPAEAAARLSNPAALSEVLGQAQRAYELVVLDTAAGMHGPSLVALSLSDYLLVPLQAEPLALRSITRVLEAVGRLRESGSRLSLAGFLLMILSSWLVPLALGSMHGVRGLV